MDLDASRNTTRRPVARPDRLLGGRRHLAPSSQGQQKPGGIGQEAGLLTGEWAGWPRRGTCNVWRGAGGQLEQTGNQ
jgi:hypothetical protein